MSKTLPDQAEVVTRIKSYHEMVGDDINFAFQTIIDAKEQEVVGFEALVRGIQRESASTVISRISRDKRFDFDQACRIRAIEAAARFGIDNNLHLNCSDIKADNIAQVLDICQHVARTSGIRPDHIVLELGNLGMMGNANNLIAVRRAIRAAGFRVLADNFGRRDADLRPIAHLEPSMLKLDHTLVHDIHQSRANQSIVRGVMALCDDRGVEVIAAGVETADEFKWLQESGVRLFQGYYFAQPGMDESASA